MRYLPDSQYEGFPCSYVAAGCAYEAVTRKPFPEQMPDGLKEDGWATLENMNRYIRSILSVRKKVYYKRQDRIPLRKFLTENTEKCIVCVHGHFLYADKDDYWSFFENDADPVVCVWYLKC